jgi:hypothetical protein
MICGCGIEFTPKPNQRRCPLCIALAPHRGKHAASKLGEKYVREAKVRLSKKVKHWKIGMGINALKIMFPDMYERR